MQDYIHVWDGFEEAQTLYWDDPKYREKVITLYRIFKDHEPEYIYKLDRWKFLLDIVGKGSTTDQTVLKIDRIHMYGQPWFFAMHTINQAWNHDYKGLPTSRPWGDLLTFLQEEMLFPVIQVEKILDGYRYTMPLKDWLGSHFA